MTTLRDIEKLAESGRIRGYKVIGSKKEDRAKTGSKYRNTKLFAELPDGTKQKFDSKREYCRYNELAFLHRIGEISELKLQVVFQLSVCKYVADFTYKDKTGNLIVEDVKSVATKKLPTYRLKKKLMLKERGIGIKEY